MKPVHYTKGDKDVSAETRTSTETHTDPKVGLAYSSFFSSVKLITTIRKGSNFPPFISKLKIDNEGSISTKVDGSNDPMRYICTRRPASLCLSVAFSFKSVFSLSIHKWRGGGNTCKCKGVRESAGKRVHMFPLRFQKIKVDKTTSFFLLPAGSFSWVCWRVYRMGLQVLHPNLFLSSISNQLHFAFPVQVCSSRSGSPPPTPPPPTGLELPLSWSRLHHISHQQEMPHSTFFYLEKYAVICTFYISSVRSHS